MTNRARSNTGKCYSSQFLIATLVSLVVINGALADSSNFDNSKARGREHETRKVKLFELNLPLNALAKTLVEFGVQADIAVIVPFDLVSGYTSSPIVGEFTLSQALEKMLWRSPLTYRIDNQNGSQIVIIEKKISPLVSSINRVPEKAEQSDSVEEVLVTGIRASLERSLNRKFSADGIIDVITAEDIGKFPDTNLAESIQRITGVSISRTNGEGSKVTVRGFGEEYNLVTLNGRTLPAASAPASAVAGTRAFEFSTIASEGVRGVDVYKTSSADLATGGIGATINIRTAKPFDFSEPVQYLGLKAVTDTTNRTGRDVTPELATMLSWNDGETWGAAFFGSIQQRDSGSSSVVVDDWKTAAWVPLGEAGAVAMHKDLCSATGGNPNIDQCATVVNPPANGQLYSLPSQLHYNLTDAERARINAQLTLQYKPTDKITATLDYTFSQNTTTGYRSQQSLLSTDNRSYLSFDDGAVKTPVIYTETIFSSDGDPVGKGIRYEQQAFDIVNENKSLGLNVLFDVNDNLTLTVDAHKSSAVSGPGSSNFGSSATMSIGANVVGTQTLDWRGDFPILNIGINDSLLQPYGSADGVFTAADIGTQVASAYYSKQSADVSQLRLDADIGFSAATLKIGIDVRSMESRMLFSEASYVLGDWGITDPVQLPDEYFRSKDFAEEFGDYAVGNSFQGGYVSDFRQIADWATTEYASRMSEGLRYTTDWGVDRKVKESTRAAYVQSTFDFETFKLPTLVVAGVRYEQTDVDSSINILLPAEIVWLDNNDFTTIYSDQRRPIDENAHYSHILPNLNMAVDLTEKFKARISFSKSIARASYGQLSASASGFDVFGVTTPGLVTATAFEGNPHIKPIESDNFDFSLEFYRNDFSYISAGYYRKSIDNFIGIKPVVKPLFNLRDSSSGARADAARAALEADPDFDGTITPTDLFNQIAATTYNDLDSQGLDTYYGDEYDIHPETDDPLYQVTAFTPFNNKKATISGFEFAIQHFFGESGFGALFNYTTVNGDVKYNVAAQPSATQFALIGLSDTMNAVAIYEKYGFQARIAYNWRDEFLALLAEEPRFTEAYSQIDMMLSYDFTDSFTLSFEGLNLGGENSRQHGRSSAQLWQLEQLGARYMLGMQFRF